MEPIAASEERHSARGTASPRTAAPSIFDHMMSAGMPADEVNRLKILVDGDKLQIAGQNVDLEGIGTLRKMLEKYEEILRLQKGEN